MYSQIESHNSLKTRNSSLLTFLAAIYVPIAFVTVSAILLLINAPN